ncbi:xanthine dehydrogenase family protein molybdopterin-binding subunit [Tepidibacter aestuarii]|uniref:xanthine dehydrogenase family protein molybdopterin-binding subunit n=1 Tax=Tepidibacter aestuarii TaxID=2925782 RepID=UPI0020BE991C|nr:xanthine dehydrogenase family protein molybdopterin-binding subunit [Tepidibacter aestuarii]CAH2213754.1 Xanthine dehydrogenase, molybdenum binding subunit apoprotein [Tepidibacter aestuarii]
MVEEISKSIKRFDTGPKIRGDAEYLCDMDFEDLVYAKTLRSSRPRAKILSIEIPDLPKGYYIVDKNDVLGRNRVKTVFDDQPFFAEDVVNYVGEPILLVVGPKKDVILNIISEIKVIYEDIDPILSIEDAENEVKKPIFQNQKCFVDYEYKKGNIDEIIKESINFIEGEYKTGYQEHAYLETQGMIGIYENEKVTIYGSMQCPYYVKDAVVQGLGWDEKRVRVIQSTTGGAFGGKEEYTSLIGGHVAIAAVKVKRPVKLLLDRSEDIECTTKRHPSIIKIKTYFDSNNIIIARDIDIKIDAGAYAGLSSIVLQREMFSVTGVYNIQNLRVRGRAFATNNVVSGAFRGFGGPQAIFAMEIHMENIADQLDIDSIELKKKYLLKRGDTSSTQGLFQYDIKLDEIISEIEKISDYTKKRKKNEKNPDKLKGIGCSLFFHGCGFTGNGEQEIIKAKIKLKKYLNEKVEIFVSNVEMGQGASTTLKKIVSHALEIPIEHIIFKNPDTDNVPDSGPTAASRTIIIVGKLLEDGAREMKEQWNQFSEIEIKKTYKYPENMKWDAEKLEGNAYEAYSWGANVVEVEIDPITYEITTTGIWAVYDIGKAIDEQIVQGQIEGGIIQGLGYGTIEVMDIKDGKLLQKSMTDYIIPTSKDFPNIKIKLIDNPYEHGPFGSKGLGELTFVGAPAAIALAVQNAIGIPIKKIPITPEYLMELMKNGK